MGKIKGKYIADDSIDEANLELETGPTNDFVLTADDSKSGGMKWATAGAGHSQQHAITSTSDHTSSATENQILQADANGLPVDATNTDAQVSAAVTASHASGSDDQVASDFDHNDLSNIDAGDINHLTDTQVTALHDKNTDTALGSGAVAADHGTAATDQIINVCYGTSATPPTASTTTEGTLYIQHAA